MSRWWFRLVLIVVLSMSWVPAGGQDVPKPAAATPSKKVGKDGKDDLAFLKHHAEFVERAKQGDVDVVFWGDSITAGWRAAGKEVWAKHFEPLKAVNFGIGGDRTQHVLWRILNGELDGIRPKLAVVMIGTNNTNSQDSPADIAAGVQAVVSAIREKSSDTKVLLLAVFPRGTNDPDPTMDPANLKLIEVNKLLSKLDDGKAIRFLDIGDKLLVNGKMSKEIMPDHLHLSAKGYAIWAEAVLPAMREILETK
jgi:lysophospholipase L1-like esterase